MNTSHKEQNSFEMIQATEAARHEHTVSSEHSWKGINQEAGWSLPWWGGAGKLTGLGEGCSVSVINAGKNSVNINDLTAYGGWDKPSRVGNAGSNSTSASVVADKKGCCIHSFIHSSTHPSTHSSIRPNSIYGEPLESWVLALVQ